MPPRPMTKEEKIGFAVCTDCKYSCKGTFYEGRPCGDTFVDLFCKRRLPAKVFNFVDGTVDEHVPEKSRCKYHNKDGLCKIYEE